MIIESPTISWFHAVKYVDDIQYGSAVTEKGMTVRYKYQQTSKAAEWSASNSMQLNTDKTKEMLIYYGKKNHNLKPITLDGQDIECVNQSKLLGVFLNNQLTWHDYVEYMCSKASRRLYFSNLMKWAGLSCEDMLDV